MTEKMKAKIGKKEIWMQPRIFQYYKVTVLALNFLYQNYQMRNKNSLFLKTSVKSSFQMQH